MKMETGSVYEGVELISMGSNVFVASKMPPIPDGHLVSFKVATVKATQEVINDYNEILKKYNESDDVPRDEMNFFERKLCRTIGFNKGELSAYQLSYNQRVFVLLQTLPITK